MITQRELDIMTLEAQQFVQDLFEEFRLGLLGRRAMYFEELEVENAEEQILQPEREKPIPATNG